MENNIGDRQPTDEQAIVREALERWKNANEAETENRRAAIEDQEFLNGEHWPENIKRAREDQNRPCLTINRLPAFLDQVVGDARKNRPRIKVRPVDDKSDTKVADILSGIIRNIEYQNNADAIYDYVLEQAAGSGFSYFLLGTKYVGNDTFDQEVTMRRIRNCFSVYLDPDAQEPDKSDASWGFVCEDISKEEFKRRYPKADEKGQDWERGYGEEYSNWFQVESVRVADYYKKVYKERKIMQLSDGSVVSEKDVDKALTAARFDDYGVLLPPLTVVKTRTVKDVEVQHYKISGNSILEPMRKWAGDNIPIIAVLGKELNVQGRTIYRGLIRHAKDSARMYNYWRTLSTEVVALAPKAPWIAAAEQVEGYEAEWRTANTSNTSLLRYKYIPGLPLPQRTSPGTIPTGMVNEAQISVDDQKAVIGIYDAGLGKRSNETSGLAIRERKRESDTGTYAFPDNLARSLGNAGRQMIEVIRRLYDTPRIVRIRGLDDSERFVMVNQQIPPESGNKYTHDGKPLKDGQGAFYDLSVGKYDVVVDTGPSASTQRTEAAESMLDFVKAVPAAGEVTMDLVADSMDWPKREEFAKRLRKVLPPGVADPMNDEDGQPEPPKPPSPQEQAAMQAQQAAQEIEKAKLQLEFAKIEVEKEKLQVEKMKVASEEKDDAEKMRAIAIDVMREVYSE